MSDPPAAEPRGTDTAATPAPRGRRRLLPRRPRHVVVTAAAVVVLASAAALVVAARLEPLDTGSGAYSVHGEDLELLRVGTPADGHDVYIAPFVEGERVTLRFPLHNTSSVPVRLLEIFPPARATPCGWHPIEVAVSPPDRQRFEPFAPGRLGAGDSLDVRLTGEFRCPHGQARIEALTYHETVPITYRLAGIVGGTAEVDPGYRFGWTTLEPETFTDDLVHVIPPHSSSQQDGGES